MASSSAPSDPNPPEEEEMSIHVNDTIDDMVDAMSTSQFNGTNDITLRSENASAVMQDNENDEEIAIINDDDDDAGQDVPAAFAASTSRPDYTIDLSSDEEGEGDDDQIQLLAIRPKSKSRLLDPMAGPTAEEAEAADTTSSSGTAVEVTAEKRTGINITERNGYVKVDNYL